jgi:hypothetical protein
VNKVVHYPLTHYDIHSLAKSLKLTSIDVIKTSSMDIESHWFRSNGPADLYFWKAKNKIVKHQISLFNQVVEWNEYDGVKTGYVNDDIDGGRAEVICFDQNVNQRVVAQAIDFLLKVEELDEQMVQQFVRHYQFYNKWPSADFFASLRRLWARIWPF